MTLAQHKLKGFDPTAARPAGVNLVTMSNALINAAQGLTLSEKQVIMLAVSKLDSRKFHAKDDLPRVRISASEFSETYEIDMKNAYAALKGATSRLYERSITFREQAPSRKKTGRDPGERVFRCRWIGSQIYQDGEGWAEVVFWPELVPHLTALSARFTSYQLKQVGNLRSLYSWRLLELLSKFGREGGKATIEIGDFCHAMEATEKQQANFAAIRRKIIEPAVAELIAKDNWIINWTPSKQGRKVAALNFVWLRNPQPDLFSQGERVID